MRIRKHVVYRFEAEEPPGDLVKRHSLHFTRWGAVREAKRMGGRTVRMEHGTHVYYSASRLPRKVPWLVRRKRRIK